MIIKIGRLLTMFLAGEDAAVWTPLVLKPTGYWNAATLSSLFQERTSPATASAVDGVVGTWNNLGSAAFAAMVAPSDAARPLLKNSGTVYWVEGDGVDDRLVTTALLSAFCSASDYEIIVAGRSGASANNKVFVDSGGGRLYAPIQRTGPPDYLRARNDGATAVTRDITYTPQTDFVWAQRSTGGTMYSRLNAGTEQTDAVTDLSQVTNPLGFLGTTSAALFGAHRIYAVGIWSTVLSSADRLLARQYFAALCASPPTISS